MSIVFMRFNRRFWAVGVAVMKPKYGALQFSFNLLFFSLEILIKINS